MAEKRERIKEDAGIIFWTISGHLRTCTITITYYTVRLYAGKPVLNACKHCQCTLDVALQALINFVAAQQNYHHANDIMYWLEQPLFLIPYWAMLPQAITYKIYITAACNAHAHVNQWKNNYKTTHLIWRLTNAQTPIVVKIIKPIASYTVSEKYILKMNMHHLHVYVRQKMRSHYIYYWPVRLNIIHCGRYYHENVTFTAHQLH